jgi:hypothetical protein
MCGLDTAANASQSQQGSNSSMSTSTLPPKRSTEVEKALSRGCSGNQNFMFVNYCTRLHKYHDTDKLSYINNLDKWHIRVLIQTISRRQAAFLPAALDKHLGFEPCIQIESAVRSPGVSATKYAYSPSSMTDKATRGQEGQLLR